MSSHFSRRILKQRPSFIKEILHFIQQPGMISFAGGIPHNDVFPIEQISQITGEIIDKYKSKSLQYNQTSGFPPLKDLIAKNYKEKLRIRISSENILITSGSQQSLDLIGKVFINANDRLLLESPSYLGAIEAFAMYEPKLAAIPLDKDGVDIGLLEMYLKKYRPKLFYTVPNFQNPSGISYSFERRAELAALLEKHDVVLVEDDPYRELRFTGEKQPPISSFMNHNFLLLDSFSKTVAPGLRVGTVVAPAVYIEQMISAKQACDVHTSILSQMVIYEYLSRFGLDEHLRTIKSQYSGYRDTMVSAIKAYFPKEVSFSIPDGGMFIWCKLPRYLSAKKLLAESVCKNVAFVPGNPFFLDNQGDHCFRLNFTNSSTQEINRGIEILGNVINKFLKQEVERIADLYHSQKTTANTVMN